jgi:hypothetical protein
MTDRVPDHFADCAQLEDFANANGLAYYWQDTPGFAKYRRRYGSRSVVVPVTTRRGVTLACCRGRSCKQSAKPGLRS